MKQERLSEGTILSIENKISIIKTWIQKFHY